MTASHVVITSDPDAPTQGVPSDKHGALESRLIAAVTKNPHNRLILARAHQLGVSDWWLTSGCVAQSVWNDACGRPIGAGIRDYDLIYYDVDTSWEAEDAIIRNAQRLFADLPVDVEVRNQARVPLWYEAKFGIPFGTVSRASDGIDRFPCATVAVGITRRDEQFEVYAPFGLDDLFEGHLRPNKALPIADVYAAKAERWQSEWPHLSMQLW